MAELVRQLVLDLPVEPRFGPEDFLVGPSNAAAHARIEAWPDWPGRLLRLEGPAGSGKSHLAAIWASKAGARTVLAADVAAPEVPLLVEAGALAIEDLDGGSLDERAMFHLLNLARERDVSILLTSQAGADRLGLRLPDLLSRLRLAPSVALEPPDDALLRAVLVKLFHDRQLAVDTSVVEYLLARMERSLARVGAVVAALDREALSRGRRVTRPMASALLAEQGELADGDC